MGSNVTSTFGHRPKPRVELISPILSSTDVGGVIIKTPIYNCTRRPQMEVGKIIESDLDLGTAPVRSKQRVEQVWSYDNDRRDTSQSRLMRKETIGTPE